MSMDRRILFVYFLSSPFQSFCNNLVLKLSKSQKYDIFMLHFAACLSSNVCLEIKVFVVARAILLLFYFIIFVPCILYVRQRV